MKVPEVFLQSKIDRWGDQEMKLCAIRGRIKDNFDSNH